VHYPGYPQYPVDPHQAPRSWDGDPSWQAERGDYAPAPPSPLPDPYHSEDDARTALPVPYQPGQPAAWDSWGARPPGTIRAGGYTIFYGEASQPSAPWGGAGYGQYGQGYGYWQDPASGYQGAYLSPWEAPAVTPRRSRAGMVIRVITLLTVLALVAVSAAFAVLSARNLHSPPQHPSTTSSSHPLPRTLPSLPSGFTRYTDKGNHFSIGVPSGFAPAPGEKTTAGLSAVTLEDPTMGAFCLLGWQPALGKTATQQDARAALEDDWKQLSAGLPAGGTLTRTPGSANISIGGQVWTQESADATLPVGETQALFRVVLDVTAHGNAIYLIGFLSLSSQYDSLDQQYFQPMRDTFAFLPLDS
jgi:hypothetical protein